MSSKLESDVYGWRRLVKATEVTAGLAESYGSQLPGGWLKVTCGMIACTQDQLRAQRSVTSMGIFYLTFFVCW